MVTGLSDQHTSYVLQAPSIKSKSTNSSRCSGPYSRESKTTLPRRHHVGIQHHITRRNLKTYKNHRMPQNQHGACNHRIASVHHSKLRNLACSHASGEISPRTPVKTPGPNNRMLYANPAANSSAIRQQNKHVSEHSGVLRLSRRMRGLPPDTGLNILNAIFVTPNNSNPRNCRIQQHKDSKIMLQGIQCVNKVIQERLGFVHKDTRKEMRHNSSVGDSASNASRNRGQCQTCRRGGTRHSVDTRVRDSITYVRKGMMGTLRRLGKTVTVLSVRTGRTSVNISSGEMDRRSAVMLVRSN